jgi:hypothetical protein
LADVGLLVTDADEEGVDDRFIVALSGVESSYGKNITATWGPYNAWSDSQHCALLQGHCQSVNPYTNATQAIEGVINNITNGPYYFQSGLVTTDAIYSVYCVGCSAGSPTGPWASSDSSLNHIYLGYLGGGVLANPREVDFARCQP